MAKPRIFVSSTYYDLKHIRNSLDEFIKSLGYDPVRSENGDIPFQHDKPLDESCYSEIKNCHMLVMIIGGRYGSATSDSETKRSQIDIEEFYEHYNSITKKEYETARERDIPIFIFVENTVYAEYETYKENRDNRTIKYKHVDSENIYKLLDDILAQRRNNFVKDFEEFDDIKSWLRDQWAGLFADFLSKKSSETSIKDLSAQIASLQQVSDTLKTYSESIIRKVEPDNGESIISEEEKKLRTIEIDNFVNEDIINYFVKHRDSRKKKIDNEKLFQSFKNSSSIIEFLKLSGLESGKNMIVCKLPSMRNGIRQLHARYKRQTDH